MLTTGLLDEAYEQLHGTGPEFEGWLSNHGPMAADALLRLGHDERLPGWLAQYVKRLEPAPGRRWAITAQDWREPLGDPSRLGDWCALLAQQVRAEPWEAVLARWWPRLLPGAVASAAHGLIRTGHAVRALREQVTDPRLDELGLALAYWAARWQPLPSAASPRWTLDVDAALDAVPVANLTGGFRTRLALLAQNVDLTEVLQAPAPAPAMDPAQVPAALDALVDAAVSRYGRWGHGRPVMLVHAATAPRAVALALPSLPRHPWPASYAAALALTLTISAAYRPALPAPQTDPHAQAEDVVQRAVECGDEHAIKFTEVALESHRRGNPTALSSAALAAALIAAD